MTNYKKNTFEITKLINNIESLGDLNKLKNTVSEDQNQERFAIVHSIWNIVQFYKIFYFQNNSKILMDKSANK